MEPANSSPANAEIPPYRPTAIENSREILYFPSLEKLSITLEQCSKDKHCSATKISNLFKTFQKDRDESPFVTLINAVDRLTRYYCKKDFDKFVNSDFFWHKCVSSMNTLLVHPGMNTTGIPWNHEQTMLNGLCGRINGVLNLSAFSKPELSIEFINYDWDLPELQREDILKVLNADFAELSKDPGILEKAMHQLNFICFLLKKEMDVVNELTQCSNINIKVDDLTLIANKSLSETNENRRKNEYDFKVFNTYQIPKHLSLLAQEYLKDNHIKFSKKNGKYFIQLSISLEGQIFYYLLIKSLSELHSKAPKELKTFLESMIAEIELRKISNTPHLQGINTIISLNKQHRLIFENPELIYKIAPLFFYINAIFPFDPAKKVKEIGACDVFGALKDKLQEQSEKGISELTYGWKCSCFETQKKLFEACRAKLNALVACDPSLEKYNKDFETLSGYPYTTMEKYPLVDNQFFPRGSILGVAYTELMTNPRINQFQAAVKVTNVAPTGNSSGIATKARQPIKNTAVKSQVNAPVQKQAPIPSKAAVKPKQAKKSEASKPNDTPIQESPKESKPSLLGRATKHVEHSAKKAKDTLKTAVKVVKSQCQDLNPVDIAFAHSMLSRRSNPVSSVVSQPSPNFIREPLPGEPGFITRWDYNVTRWPEHPFKEPLSSAIFGDYADLPLQQQIQQHIFHELHPLVNRFLPLGENGKWTNETGQNYPCKRIFASIEMDGHIDFGVIEFTYNEWDVGFHKWFRSENCGLEPDQHAILKKIQDNAEKDRQFPDLSPQKNVTKGHVDKYNSNYIIDPSGVTIMDGNRKIVFKLYDVSKIRAEQAINNPQPLALSRT